MAGRSTTLDRPVDGRVFCSSFAHSVVLAQHCFEEFVMDRPNRTRTSTRPDAPSAKRSLPSSKSPATKRGRDTRDKLLIAARDIFSRTAYADVRVIDITAEAGVASGTFYTYFDSKEEIFREIAARVLKEMSEAFRGGVRDPDQSIAGRVEANTRCYFACVRENASIARSIEEIQARDAGVGTARHETLGIGVQKIELWIRRLQERGICDSAIDPWPTALALHAMNVSVAYDHLVYRDAPDETDVLLKATTRIWCSTLGLDC
jgi:AcrR family transcriptional regulator